MFTNPRSFEPSPFPSRKRSHSDDYPENSHEPTHKRLRNHDAVSDYNEPREVHIIGDDNELNSTMRGEGSLENPIQFIEWESAEIIESVHGGVISLLSDDEDTEDSTSITWQSIESEHRGESGLSLLHSTCSSPHGHYSARDSQGSNDSTQNRSSTRLNTTSDDSPPFWRSHTPVHRFDNSSEIDLDRESVRFHTLFSAGLAASPPPRSPYESTATLSNSSRQSSRASSPFNAHSHSAESCIVRSEFVHRNLERSPVHGRDVDTDQEIICCVEIDDDYEEEEEEEEEEALDRISSQIPLWESWSNSDHIKKEPEETDAESGLEEEQAVWPFQLEYRSTSTNARDQSEPQPSSPPNPPKTPSLETLPPRNPTLTFSPHSRSASPTLPTEESTAQTLRTSRAETIHKKHLFYTCYAPKMLPYLRKRLAAKTAHHVQPPAPSNPPHTSCHIYTGPCTKNNVTMCVRFRDPTASTTHQLLLNYGAINLLVHDRLSARDIHGLVHDWWHTSHLCGNWRCVNVEHVVAEPGPVNLSRNRCLRPGRRGRTERCAHRPRCLVELTAPIGGGERGRKLGRGSGGGEGGVEGGILG